MVSERPFAGRVFALLRRWAKGVSLLSAALALACTAAAPPEDTRLDSETLRASLERDLQRECAADGECGASLTLLGNGCPYAVAYAVEGTDTSTVRARLAAISDQSRQEFAAATEPQAVCDALPLRGAVCRDGICRPDFGLPSGL